jgi:hypothetical protein
MVLIIRVYQHSACLRPRAQSLITNSPSSKQTTTALFTLHKASSWTLLVACWFVSRCYSLFSDSITEMDPSQAQSPPSSRLSAMVLNSSPSVQLAAMALNSPPVRQAPRDAPTDPTSAPGRVSSSYTSLFGGTSSPRTPHLAESPSPARGLPTRLPRSTGIHP